ncbi:hypothetical protein C6568_08575 [Melaminivora suipulveris]|uniref:ApeI dehydratase-like domain-containing protein n=1 Tax=Melaminivora suipulveris TaxID=2109913 RepID=A0A2R3QC12_9BURK|nr:beta-hydroxyacyl-ACP dehydratase [Melaminivora suipulveris]AVO49311.1 hypothetical protein C6568_08575 [Melaminivora suipulveris]
MRAEWTVPADHPAFAGHFPDRPILPGVVLLDRALLLAQTLAPMAQWSIAQAKFQRPVGPGQTLTLELGEVRAGLWELRVRSASRLVASGSLRQHEEGAP